MEDEGWVYCLSNPSFRENIHKVGKTNADDVEDRADKLYSTGVPTPFKIELAARFDNCTQAEKNIHNLLSYFCIRINDKREFFDCTIGEVIIAFESQNPKGEIIINPERARDDEEKLVRAKPMRDHTVFEHKQRVRHIQNEDTLMGYWDKEKSVIRLEDDPDKTFQAFTSFDNYHRRELGITTRGANGWRACEVEKSDGTWIKAELYLRDSNS